MKQTKASEALKTNIINPSPEFQNYEDKWNQRNFQEGLKSIEKQNKVGRVFVFFSSNESSICLFFQALLVLFCLVFC